MSNVTQLGKARSTKSGDGNDWTPVEMLRSVLQQMESGEIDVERAVLIYQGPRDKNGERDSGFANATPDVTTCMGMLKVAEQQIFKHSSFEG